MELASCSPYIAMTFLHFCRKYTCVAADLGQNCFSRLSADDRSMISLKDEIVAHINGPRREKTCLRGLANNKGADQPVHSRSPISYFVIR